MPRLYCDRQDMVQVLRYAFIRAILYARSLAATILLIPVVVCAGPAPPQGVWSGFIGTKAIIACFNEGSRFGSYASYYYIDRLKPIALSTREKDSLWHEQNDTGLWELSAPVDKVVVGTWSQPKAQKSQPIRLKFVDGRDDKSACARDSYNARLELAPKIETMKVEQFSLGRTYRRLRFAGQETVEFFGLDPAIETINAQLKLDQSKEAVDSYFQQRREFLGRVGYPAVDDIGVNVLYWDAHFIAIDIYTRRAGEGRSGVSTDRHTWSAVTGEKVDLWIWLGSTLAESKLPPKLRKYLFRGIKPSQECQAGYRGQGQFSLMLSKSGLNISEDAWGSGCEQDFTVPYAKLLPFLSPEGILAGKPLLEKK